MRHRFSYRRLPTSCPNDLGRADLVSLAGVVGSPMRAIQPEGPLPHQTVSVRRLRCGRIESTGALQATSTCSRGRATWAGRRSAGVEERRDQREHRAGSPCHVDVRRSGKHCELRVGQEFEHLHHVGQW